MRIKNPMKTRHNLQPASDLSQTSEEDFDAGQLRTWGKVLRVASIANDCMGRDAAQQKRRRRQTRRANHDVGLGEALLIGLLEISCGLHFDSVVSQFCGEPA